MPRTFHISDLHIHADPARNNTQGIPTRLAELAFSMDREDDVLVITGDIVDNGSKEEYERAHELLVPYFAGRALVCPGNHDIGRLGNLYSERALKRYRALEKALGSHPSTTVCGVAFVGLDSTKKTVHPFDAARGQIGSDQLSWLSERLSQATKAGLKSVVYLHHYAHHNGKIDDIALRLVDGDDLLREVWGVADVVLCGHDHGEFAWSCARRACTVYHMAGDFWAYGRKAWVVEV